jgi:hypothetical protein
VSRLGRALLVIAISGWSVGTLAPYLRCLWHACPNNGLDVSYGGVVNHVIRGSPAAEARIVPGDRIVPPLPRGLTREPPVALSFRLQHEGGVRAVTLTPRLSNMTRSEKLRLLALSASYLIFVVVGSLLLLLRPSPMTWSFYLYCILRRYGDLFFYWPGSSAFFWFNALTYASLGGASCALVAIFALRFPADDIQGWRRPLNYAALVVAAVLPLMWLYAFVRLDFLGLSSQELVRFLVLITSIVYAGAAAIFIITLLQSHGDARQRLQWILVFPAVLILRLAVINLPRSIPQWVFDALIALAVCIPLTVAYAVIRRRVFDVQFVISRALVYGSLTSLVAGTFLLLDWFMSKQFSQTRVTLTAEIIFALALGSSLNLLHRNVDRLVDGVFFRQRHLAERRLAKAATAVTRAESLATVDRFLVNEPVQALGLVSAALFRRNDRGQFVRRLDVGWSAADVVELTPNDPLVLHLLAEGGAVRLAEVAWAASETPRIANSVLAMPILLRDQIAAVVLYGPHRTGADIDPDEERGLVPLVERAGTAYDHIDAEALRAKVELLTRDRESKEREIIRLRAETKALRKSATTMPDHPSTA